MSKVENKLTTIKGLEADIVILSKWSSKNCLIFINYKQKQIIFSQKMSEQLKLFN